VDGIMNIEQGITIEEGKLHLLLSIYRSFNAREIVVQGESLHVCFILFKV
jgi:hypothetical protein